MTVEQILQGDDKRAIKALFSFSVKDPDELIELKYSLWVRYFFAKYISSEDAPFHRLHDLYNIQAYKGTILSFTNIAFRGAAKTSRTKLFFAFIVANDIGRYRKYLKVLSEDDTNSKQIVTDVYNMLISKKMRDIYPEIFEKTENKKREETMQSFTTSTGVKMISGTVGTNHRGALQEEARPDLIWFDDFENRKTLNSSKITLNVWGSMEEARTSLSKNGSCIYTCNYVSELGNVHKLVERKSNKHIVEITPILKDGKPTWDRYTVEEIEQMKQDDDDFEGERMCEPSAAKDILFDRQQLNRMEEKEPERVTAGFKIFHDFEPTHRYASGHDVGGGVGLDSSTSVFIDFDTFPARVVATFKSNTIKPEAFGDEVFRQHDMFGRPLCAVERNYGDGCIVKLKLLGADLYKMEPKGTKVDPSRPTEYGWHTNSLTKPNMIFALAKAVEDGLIELSDPDLIAECKSYTRNDLIENHRDPRLSTRHFDLLIAAAIAWQMKDHALVPIVQKRRKEKTTMTKYG